MSDAVPRLSPWGAAVVTGEYTKPVTTTIPLGDTPVSGGGDEALLTANETRTSQALVTIPVEPVKRTGEDEDKFAEPIGFRVAFGRLCSCI
jgi:hypothetical protein